MIILLFCIFVIIVLGASYYAYRIIFYSPEKKRDHTAKPKDSQYDPYRNEMKRIFQQLDGRKYESVRIVSWDGLQLFGRYYHVKENAPLDICFHGYRSHPIRDFSGGTELSFAMEHNVLLIDERAQGKSEGKTITFGLLERKDLLDWVHYAITRFGPEVNIFLYGVSMGGATVLMSAELNLPKNVRGIIADCPFSKPLDVILFVGQRHPFPNCLIKYLAILAAKIYGGFDLLETDAVRSIKHTKVPVLILHGEDDRYVPCAMSESVASANPTMVHRVTFPGAAHGISYLADTQRYHSIVKKFVQDNISAI